MNPQKRLNGCATAVLTCIIAWAIILFSASIVWDVAKSLWP